MTYVKGEVFDGGMVLDEKSERLTDSTGGAKNRNFIVGSSGNGELLGQFTCKENKILNWILKFNISV